MEHPFVYAPLIAGIMLCVVLRSSEQRSTTLVEGFEGSEVTLPCSVHHYHDLMWYKLDPTGQRERILEALRPGEVHVRRSLWRGHISIVNRADLLIHSLRADRDSGTFFCESHPGDDREYVKVVVLARVTGATIGGFQGDTVTVSAGDSITLSCTVSGNPNPEPTYSWRLGGQTLVSGARGGAYRLTADVTMNRQTITCTATNKHNNGTVISSQEETATLNVTFVGSVIISPSSVTLTEDDRETVLLKCSADGNPPVTFQWKKSGTVLITSSVYTKSSIQRSDAGEYKCQASNGMTTRSETAQVVVYYPPDVSMTYAKPTQTMTCSASGFPDNYTFSPWEQLVYGQLVRELVLVPRRTSGSASQTVVFPWLLGYEDTGNYTCTVTNGIGPKEKKHILITPEGPPVFGVTQQTSIDIRTGDTAEVSAVFYSQPQYSKVEWLRFGDSKLLEDHRELSVPVSLPTHSTIARFQGFVSTLTLTEASPVDQGNYTIRVTNAVNGSPLTAELVLIVSITDVPGDDGGGYILDPTLGAAAGVLAVAILSITFLVWYRRRRTSERRDHNGTRRASRNDRSNAAYENTDIPENRIIEGSVPVYENLSRAVSEVVYENSIPDQLYQKLQLRSPENVCDGDQPNLSTDPEHANCP